MRRLISNILATLFFLTTTQIYCGCVLQDEVRQVVELNWQEPDSIFNVNSDYIVVIGDIQEYTVSDEMVYYLNETCDWIRSQQKYFNCITCVLQDGDLTWNNFDYQWSYADFAFAHLGSDILLIPSIGNHDYTWHTDSEIKDRTSTLLNSMRSLGYLRGLPMEQFEEGRLDNIIVPVKVGNDTMNIISLEFGPRKEVVTWADSTVQHNPKKKYILMTHEWMSRDGERIVSGSYADTQFPNLSHSTPQEIWERLVYPNDNILCVLCGHNGFCKYLYSTNQAGREVCQVLFNLQYQENGGDGMIQLWEFPKDKNIINISVYNTIKREFHSNPDTSISVQY